MSAYRKFKRVRAYIEQNYGHDLCDEAVQDLNDVEQFLGSQSYKPRDPHPQGQVKSAFDPEAFDCASEPLTPSEQIHIYHQGAPLCRLLPDDCRQWPSGHTRVGPADYQHATCECCINAWATKMCPKPIDI